MNFEHFKAFLWLRGRLRVNQLKKGGIVSTVLLTLLAVGAVMVAVVTFVGGFLAGLLGLPEAPPAVRLYIWDGAVVAFLFFWSIGLLTDLQRSEGLALDKFLHLPVSVSSAFLINYTSSFFSLTLLMFGPGLLGLLLGQVFAFGPVMLLGLPLFAAFVFAITALTYQFQGWLATLMANPRRRRTVVVLFTLGFILLTQVPNMVNMLARPWEFNDAPMQARLAELEELRKEQAAKKMSSEEYLKRSAAISKAYDDRRAAESRRVGEQAEGTAWLVSAVLPPGWLALGAATLPDGNVVPALLGTLGLGLIGAASLWRAYRTTLRLYTGQFVTGESKKATTADADPAKPRLVEWRLPWVSEHASAVATAAYRSLTRAPEAKMMLLTPLIILVVFGGIALSLKVGPPAEVRPLIAFAAASMVLLTASQLVGNQFGYDRTGFRAYVLAPVPRRDVLLGKNLAAAPMTLGLAGVMVVLVGCVYPMRVDLLLATLVQVLSVFLIFCALANVLSILGPIPMAAGSFQPANVRMTPILLHLAFMLVFPVALMPTLVPLGVDLLVAELTGVHGIPIALVLSLGLFVAVVFAYRKVLDWQGEWLANRERTILEVVTSKSE